MRNRAHLALAIVFTLLLGGTAPTHLQREDVRRDLDALLRRGFTYRMVGDDLIELTDPVTGEKKVKSLCEPDETRIRVWASRRDVPILEIDPNTVDTTEYTGWYNYWSTVPLSNGLGNPLVIGDVNGNGLAEVYGDSLARGYDYRACIYELGLNGSRFRRHEYAPRPGISRDFTDANDNELREVLYTRGGTAKVFEQRTLQALPIDSLFTHERHEGGLDPGFAGIYVGLLDADSLTDFLYKGSEVDSINPNLTVSKTYVTEFSYALNNFVRVWSTTYGQEAQSVIGGFAVGDFDLDGRKEFVTTHLFTGEVFLVENTGDNAYALTWHDSVPYVNLYYQCAGDVDGDGKSEFFVGATMSSGNWTTMFEADSNNHYSPKFIFHLLSGGSLDEPTYLTADVNGDGKVELVIMSGRDLYVFRSTSDNTYSLWYLKREDTKDAVQFYDLNSDGRNDFIISKFIVDGTGRGRLYADAYTASTLAPVREDEGRPETLSLLQNYPNPFNPTTTIAYSLESHGQVTICIYDLLGQLVTTLVSAEQVKGHHVIEWNAENLASGIYICRMETSGASVAMKLVLIR